MRRAGGLALTALLVAHAPGADGQIMPPPPPPSAARPASAPEPLVNIPVGAPRLEGSLSLLFLLSKEPVPGAPGIQDVYFREEGSKPEYFAQNGGGSIAGSTQVDCGKRQFQLRSLSLYSRNNLAGALVAHFDKPTGWLDPRPMTVMDSVIQLACAGAPARPPAPVRTPPRPPPEPTAPPPSPAAAPLPAPIPAPPAQAVSRPVPATPPRAAATGNYWIQVASNPTDQLARRDLDRLVKAEAALLAQAPQMVSTGTVGGAPVFRSLLGPYPDQRSAAGLCAQLTARHHACFVRKQ